MSNLPGPGRPAWTRLRLSAGRALEKNIVRILRTAEANMVSIAERRLRDVPRDATENQYYSMLLKYAE